MTKIFAYSIHGLNGGLKIQKGQEVVSCPFAMFCNVFAMLFPWIDYVIYITVQSL